MEDAEKVHPLEKPLLLRRPAFDKSLGGLDGDVAALEDPELGTAKEDLKCLEFVHASFICR